MRKKSASAMPMGQLVVSARRGRSDDEDDVLDMVERERVWLSERLHERLAATKNVAAVLKDVSQAEMESLERALAKTSLSEVLCALENGLCADIFRSLFSAEDWTELEESAAFVENNDEEAIRQVMLKRQRHYLVEAQKSSVGAVSKDQIVLLRNCAETLHAILKNMELMCLPEISADEMDEQISFVQNKGEGVKKKKNGKKREEREKKKKNKTKRKERKSLKGKKAAEKKAKMVEKNKVAQEPSDQELQVTRLRRLFEKAALDVDAVKKMVKDARLSGENGLVLRTGKLPVPNAHLASAEEGKLVLESEESLRHVLLEQLDGGHQGVEQWGTLLKWWAIVQRAYSFAGVFACLRAKRRGKKSLKDRYKMEADRLKKHGNVILFAQASVYDRLGVFLLKYPKFVFQLQFVTLKDWMEKFFTSNGEKRCVLDGVEELVSAELLVSWKEAIGEEPTVSPSHAQGEGEEGFRACAACLLGGGTERGELWSCAECGLE